MSKIRVTLAENHPIVRAGIRALLNSVGDIDLVHEATNGLTAVESIERTIPDVAIFDISLAGLTGLEVARALGVNCPKVRSLVLTSYEDGAYVQAMEKLGVKGYLLKRSAAEELVSAIRSIAGGGVYFDVSIADKTLVGSVESSPVRCGATKLSSRS